MAYNGMELTFMFDVDRESLVLGSYYLKWAMMGVLNLWVYSKSW